MDDNHKNPLLIRASTGEILRRASQRAQRLGFFVVLFVRHCSGGGGTTPRGCTQRSHCPGAFPSPRVFPAGGGQPRSPALRPLPAPDSRLGFPRPGLAACYSAPPRRRAVPPIPGSARSRSRREAKLGGGGGAGRRCGGRSGATQRPVREPKGGLFLRQKKKKKRLIT